MYLFTAGFASGGPALTQANAVYTITGAPGDLLGTSLATGDLDNDGRREIIIGAPGNGRVYIIKGASNLSGTLDLSSATAAPNKTITQNLAFLFTDSTGPIPTAATGSFNGVNVGHEGATWLRILDIDADGKSDMAIDGAGAPPYGSFDAPADGAAVKGTVDVAGWALDDVGVAKVEVWREPGPGESSTTSGVRTLAIQPR